MAGAERRTPSDAAVVLCGMTILWDTFARKMKAEPEGRHFVVRIQPQKRRERSASIHRVIALIDMQAMTR